MYRHEKPTDPDDPLADQNIKDRFFGINDPVADKLMRRYDTMPKLDVPEDKLVTTLYVGNLADRVSEKDLRYVSVRPNCVNGCVKSQTYQGATTKYK